MNFKNVLIFVLVLACAILIFTDQLRSKQLQSLKNKNAVLENELKAKLSYNPKTSVVSYVYRDKVVTKNVYVEIKNIPKESKIEIKIDKDNNIITSYSTFGLTLSPGIGFNYVDDFYLAGNLRFLYFWNFGLGIDATKKGVGTYVDYRLNGIFNGLFSNTSVGVGLNQGMNLKVNVFF